MAIWIWDKKFNRASDIKCEIRTSFEIKRKLDYILIGLNKYELVNESRACIYIYKLKEKKNEKKNCMSDLFIFVFGKT